MLIQLPLFCSAAINLPDSLINEGNKILFHDPPRGILFMNTLIKKPDDLWKLLSTVRPPANSLRYSMRMPLKIPIPLMPSYTIPPTAHKYL